MEHRVRREGKEIKFYPCSFSFPESTKHIMAIAYSEQDSETTMLLNTALNTEKKQSRRTI